MSAERFCGPSGASGIGRALAPPNRSSVRAPQNEQAEAIAFLGITTLRPSAE